MTATSEKPVSRGTVRVTPRQVQAAKIALRADARLGRPSEPSIVRIAHAKQARSS